MKLVGLMPDSQELIAQFRYNRLMQFYLLEFYLDSGQHLCLEFWQL